MCAIIFVKTPEKNCRWNGAPWKRYSPIEEILWGDCADAQNRGAKYREVCTNHHKKRKDNERNLRKILSFRWEHDVHIFRKRGDRMKLLNVLWFFGSKGNICKNLPQLRTRKQK